MKRATPNCIYIDLQFPDYLFLFVDSFNDEELFAQVVLIDHEIEQMFDFPLKWLIEYIGFLLRISLLYPTGILSHLINSKTKPYTFLRFIVIVPKCIFLPLHPITKHKSREQLTIYSSAVQCLRARYRNGLLFCDEKQIHHLRSFPFS